MTDDDALIDALKAIGHPPRLRIVETLRAGERNVGEIEQATGITQPGLSQQLAVIRAAGLVQTRKAAKLVYYSLDQAMLAGLRDRIGALAGTSRAQSSRSRGTAPPPGSPTSPGCPEGKGTDRWATGDKGRPLNSRAPPHRHHAAARSLP